MSTVLGIDPSLTQTGLASIEGGRLVSTGVVKSKGKRTDTLEERALRISAIVHHIRMAVAGADYDLAVIEAPSFGSRHGSAHDRSGLWWATVHMLRVGWGIPVAQVSPKQRAKYGTGNGNADKKDVHDLVQFHYATEELPIKTNDEADAVLLAAMGSRYLGEPAETHLPVGAIDAMRKVVWPL